MLNNILYFNNRFYIFKLSDNTKLCSFCNQENETIIHFYANCPKSKTWNSLKEFFKDTMNLPSLIPQSAIFGFLQTDQELFIILNYLNCYFNTTYMFQDVLKPLSLIQI